MNTAKELLVSLTNALGHTPLIDSLAVAINQASEERSAHLASINMLQRDRDMAQAALNHEREERFKTERHMGVKFSNRTFVSFRPEPDRRSRIIELRLDYKHAVPDHWLEQPTYVTGRALDEVVKEFSRALRANLEYVVLSGR